MCLVCLLFIAQKHPVHTNCGFTIIVTITKQNVCFPPQFSTSEEPLQLCHATCGEADRHQRGTISLFLLTMCETNEKHEYAASSTRLSAHTWIQQNVHINVLTDTKSDFLCRPSLCWRSLRGVTVGWKLASVGCWSEKHSRCLGCCLLSFYTSVTWRHLLSPIQWSPNRMVRITAVIF